MNKRSVICALLAAAAVVSAAAQNEQTRNVELCEKAKAAIFLAMPRAAEKPTQAPPQKFPFTAEENADGARFVWFVYNQTGFPFEYVPAKALPDSKSFRPAPGNKPQAGDVAWWKGFVAIYAGDDAPRDANIVTAPKKVGLRELQKLYGPVKWYRYREDD